MVDFEDPAHRNCFGPEASPPLKSHSQPAVVAPKSRPEQRTRFGYINSFGGQDVSRLAVSGRMDSRKNGPWYCFCPGKSGKAGSCPKPICGRDVMPSLRNHGAHHTTATLQR